MKYKYFDTYNYIIYFLILFFIFIILNNIYYSMFNLKEGLKVKKIIKSVKKDTSNAAKITKLDANIKTYKIAADVAAKKSIKIAEKLSENLTIQKELIKLIKPVIIFKNTLFNTLNILK